MEGREKLKAEYEKAMGKKRELQEKLRELEKTEPSNFSKIWRTRDQVAYWEGMSEGIRMALDTLKE